MGIAGEWLIRIGLLLPVFWIVGFIAFVGLSHSKFGTWPWSGLPEPSAVGLPFLHAIIVISLYLFPLYLLVCSLGLALLWRGSGVFPYRKAVLFIGEVSLFLLLFIADPGGCFGWFMD